MLNDFTNDAIKETYEVIGPCVRRTLTLSVSPADLGVVARRATFKLEYLQHTGSFKPRGAFANLLLREVGPAGVAAASGGNHGAGSVSGCGRTSRSSGHRSQPAAEIQ